MGPEHWLFTIPLRLRSLFRRSQADQELDDELRDHLERRTEEYVGEGMAPEEARRRARLDLSGLEQTKEKCRDARHVKWIQDLIQDTRYGFRMLRKSPGFTAAAIITLAVGIGANTAIFSMANAFVFRPLPVKDGDRLMIMAVRTSQDSTPNPISYPAFLDYQRQNNVFAEMTGYTLALDGLGSQGHADRVVMCYVPSNFFTMLGLPPAAGRLILPGEGDVPRSGPVVVLGYSYWQHRFSGDQNVIGRSLNLDGRAVTVIGVVEKSFKGPYATLDMDAYAPIGMYGGGTGYTSFFTAREGSDLRVLATLKPGVSRQQAEVELNLIAQRLGQQYPQTDKGHVVRVIPERLARPEAEVSDSIALVTTIFLLMVGLVLLVACVNVTNLLLARAAAREKEIVIRATMGAGRLRLIRQALTESILLVAAGGVAGAAMGSWVCRAMEQTSPMGEIPIHIGFTFDWRVFAYVAGVVLAAGIVAGLAPALRVPRTNLIETLREGGRALIGDSAKHWARNALVIAQLAGSLIVLVAAGLFTRSLGRAESIDLGFDPHHLLNMGINPGQQGYDRPHAEAFLKELLRRIKALPGVESASLAYSIPMGYYNDGGVVYSEGQAPAMTNRAPGAGFNSVSPDYFKTLRIPIFEGRAFSETDTAQTAPVAIINEEMAKRLWPSHDPIGRRFSSISASGPFLTIVGVVRNAKYNGIADQPKMFFYLPLAQNYKDVHVLQIRTLTPPENLIPVIETQVHEMDPNLPLFDVMTMDKSLQGANGFFLYKGAAGLAGILGGLGLVIAIVGLYGVVSYTASLRTHEIGVRMALGAHPRSIFGLILRQALILVGSGAVLGLLAAFGVTRFLSTLLVGVSSYDLVTFVSVPAALVTVALTASYLPARRATRVDPMVALRYE
ncbi:MAG TPA: ABC transporter permease [Candidatus Acidoferrum sp.]